MRIETRPITEVKPYANNPRQNDDAVEAVAESIRRFGFRQPIVVDADGVIVAGHTRFRAAQRLGLATVPVHVATDLTADEVRAYRLADNKTAELASWDTSMLSIELDALRGAGIDWTLLGFDEEELAKLLAPAGTPADIITRLAEATDRALKSSGFQAELQTLGMTAEAGADPRRAAEFIRTEIAKWAPVVRSTGTTM